MAPLAQPVSAGELLGDLAAEVELAEAAGSLAWLAEAAALLSELAEAAERLPELAEAMEQLASSLKRSGIGEADRPP